MALNLEYFPVPGITANAGIFIQVDELPGLTAAELDPSLAGRESRFILSFLNAVYRRIQDLIIKPLGLSISKASPVGAGANLINQNFNLTQIYDISLLSNTVDDIPHAVAGANAGAGGFSFNLAFPSSNAVLAAGSNTVEPGVLIPSSTLNGSLALNDDNRSLITSIVRMIVDNVDLRSPTNQQSAVIAATRSNTTIFAPPASLTDPTNPTSAIPAEQLKHHAFVSLSYSMTLQLKIDDFNQTYDVNVSEANQ